MSLRISGIEYDFLAERDWKELWHSLAPVQVLAIQINLSVSLGTVNRKPISNRNDILGQYI
jgi:hypothetical protein